MTRRAVGYYATRDLIPFYAVYALLFRDHGLSPGAISSLLILWSAVSFVCEVPSGAWADLVDRRRLLVLSSALYAAGFAAWTVGTTYPWFAAGFVLWGVSGALMSGTFEALLHDELTSLGAESQYARVKSRAEAAAMAAQLAAMALAGPLYAWGGYPLVGWASVAVAAVHGVLAWSMPRASRVDEADETLVEDGDAASASGVLTRYWTMLRDGVGEATRHHVVRRIVVISAVVMGVTAFDEYFNLLAREQGAATGDIPLLMAVVVAGQFAGTLLAGRAGGTGRRAMGGAVAGAGALVAAGALAGHPAGMLAVAAGYGLVEYAVIRSEAELQAVISGRARATVTSVAGFSSELFAIACYAAVGLGSAWLSVGVLLALLCLPLLAIAAAVRSWWPER